MINLIKNLAGSISCLVFALICAISPTKSAAQIYNIEEFLRICPQEDPLFAEFVNTFSVLKNGVEVDLSALPCTSPIQDIPAADYSNELLLLVVIRTMFYMDRNQSGHLPWTDKSSFDWMSEQVNGFHITKELSVGGACCSVIDGKRYILLPERDETYRESFRSWPDILVLISLYIHEARHVEGPRHANTLSNLPECLCESLVSCDFDYNLANLGSYGAEYFFRNLLISGGINVGMANLSKNSIQSIAGGLLQNINGFAERNFCTSPPPIVELPEHPGGDLAIGPDLQEIFWGIEVLESEIFGGGSELRFTDGFIYRHFSSSGVYVGIYQNDIYVAGGDLGDEVLNVGSITSILGIVRGLLN